MKSTDNRNLFTTLIASGASSGDVATIPATQPTPGNGRAAINVGFPAETFVSRSAGGVPPFGADENGFLNLLSAAIQTLQADFFGVYDATFSSAIGGYPLNAVVSAGTVGAYWVSMVEDNTSAPGASGANWQSLFTGLALINGSSTQVFNVANAATSTEAVPLGQAQADFAALAGLSTQVFNVANAATSTEAVALGQFVSRQNANGKYIVLPDGTQFCRLSIVSIAPAGTAIWTFPLAFVSPPQVFFSVRQPSATPTGTLWESVTATDTQVSIFNGTGVTINIEAMAFL